PARPRPGPERARAPGPSYSQRPAPGPGPPPLRSAKPSSKTSSERRPDRKLDRPRRRLTRLPVEVEPIIYPDRPKHRLPSNPRPGRVPQVGQVQWRGEAAHDADVEEGRNPEGVWPGH